MNNKGTALIVTMIYLIIITIICAAVLSFSSGHYRFVSQRVDKFQNVYYSEGGLYLGLTGARGIYYIQPGDANTTVNVTSSSGNPQARRDYTAL